MRCNRNAVIHIFILILFLSYPVFSEEAFAEPPKQQEPRPVNGAPIQAVQPDTPVPQPLQLLRFELTFDNGRYYQVIKKGERPPKMICRIIAQGQGTLTGMWKIDEHNALPLQLFIKGFYDHSLTYDKLPKLPTKDSGTHSVSLKLKTPQISSSLPVLRYFVSNETPLKALAPESDTSLQLGEKVTLSWTSVKGEYQYQLVVSQTPFQFLKDSQINWMDPIPATNWTLNTETLSPGHVYWMIRAISASGRIVSASEINYFFIKEKPQSPEEVNK